MELINSDEDFIITKYRNKRNYVTATTKFRNWLGS